MSHPKYITLPFTIQITDSYENELEVTGTYWVNLNGESDDWDIVSTEGDVSDDALDWVEQMLADQIDDDIANWKADRDDYLCGQAEDRALEREFAA